MGIPQKTPLRGEIAEQVAALCYREVRKGKKEVLLVTSRDTGRWVIPKGWPMEDKSDHAAAKQEAWEEAGVKSGKVKSRALGRFCYDKKLDDGDVCPVEVAVYPLRVDDTKKSFPEADERERIWVSPKKAAKMVREPELKKILRNF